MKKYIFLSTLFLSYFTSVWGISNFQHSKEFFSERKINLAKLANNSLSNTIKFNRGDTILELYSPPVGNQGSQGSCNAWALGYGCGSILAYDVYQDINWAKRSPAFLFNIDNSNCTSNFSYAEDIAYTMYSIGSCSLYLMPYDSTDCSTSPNSTQIADATLNKISNYAHLNSNTNISEYKQILRAGYPIVIGTKYLNDLRRVCINGTLHGHWESIVNTDTVGHGHAMCVIGYNDSIGALKVLNSWGISRGDSGFVWISYNLIQSSDVINKTFVLEPGTAGFVPQIEGPTYFCDTTYYYMRNVPTGATIQWSMSSAGPIMAWLNIVGPTNRDSVMVARITGNIPVRYSESGDDITGGIFPPYTGDTSMILNATISSGGSSYSATKRIYKSTAGAPTISPSNSASSWPMGTTRTFTITNCTEVPDSQLKWQIRRRVYHNTFMLVESGQGRSITFTPEVTGYYMIKALNTANTCGTVSSALYYTVVYSGRHQLAANNDGSVLSAIIYEDQDSQLVPASLDENSEYTLELWSPIYGLMRTKGVQSATEQMSTAGLPQGVYILLLKENGNVIAETKIIIQ